MFGQIVLLRISTLGDTNLVVSRHFEKDKTRVAKNKITTTKKPQLCSCLRVTCAAGAGVDEKGKMRKTLSLAFLPPITPRALLGRDRERRLGTSRVLEPFRLNEG